MNVEKERDMLGNNEGEVHFGGDAFTGTNI